MVKSFIHDTAYVEQGATVGDDTKIWHLTQVREQASIGSSCVLGKNVFVDTGVTIGNNVKIQNNSSLYKGLTIEDGVFIGPHVCFANDKAPRAISEDGSLKTDDDWEVSPTLVKKGASLGAGVIVLPGVTIGSFALVGAGSVVTKDVEDFALVVGNPAKTKGKVNERGEVVERV